MVGMVHRESLALPRGLGTVVVETGSEHHMGANDVEIRLPFALAGRSVLRTTNGGAWLSLDASVLFVCDASVLLRIDLESLSVAHLQPPDGEYFAQVEEHESSFRCRLYDGNGGSRWVEWSKAELRFQAGPGPVVGGRFPSAYP